MKAKNLNYSVSFGNRLLLFLCITCIGYLIAGCLSWFISLKTGGASVAAMRIMAVFQDIFLFIMPSIVTALLITRLPAEFLCLTKKPKLVTGIIACLILLSAMPALNALISWNESISLPAGLENIEQSMRAAENAAQDSVKLLLNGSNPGSLVVAILVVGVLAGFSEELFFRGTLQRLLLSNRGIKPGLAILISAFIFSFIHFQFYGFFPRFLLGMYFGYLLYITGSLWIPVIVHAFNNSIYIIGTKLATSEGTPTDINSIGVENSWEVIFSILITLVLIRVLIKLNTNQEIGK